MVWANFFLDHSKKDPSQGSSLKQPHFDPIPMSYTELLPILVQSELVIPTFIKHVKPPSML